MGCRMLGAKAVVAGLALMRLSAQADEAAAPIPVVVQVPAKAYYVGQAIELRVGAEAAGERPQVETPEVPNTDVSLIGTDLSPVSATGIGELTSEHNLFITRFRLVAHRAGPLRIPPIRAQLGRRTGASRPFLVEVRSVPPAGRPAEFLGGVGAFAVEAEATPKTVRVGHDLIYTIQVTGPAARGMQNSPALTRFSQVPLGLRVEPLPAVVVNSPPSRRFRYRLRPTRPGSATLPPIAVAAFDPQTARYVTKVTSSVAIGVVNVPKFDPSTLNYVPPPAHDASGPGLPLVTRTAAGLILGIGAIVLATLAARAVRKRWQLDAGRWIIRRAQGLEPYEGAERVARAIVEILAEYLERKIGRPRGVLTPEEARTAVFAATQDAALGARCAQLVTACDRARYSDHAIRTESAVLVAEARYLFVEMGSRGVA